MLHRTKPRVRKETDKTLKKGKKEYSPTEQNDQTEEIGNNAIHKWQKCDNVEIGLTVPWGLSMSSYISLRILAT